MCIDKVDLNVFNKIVLREKFHVFLQFFVVAYVDKVNKKGKLDEKTQLFGKTKL